METQTIPQLLYRLKTRLIFRMSSAPCRDVLQDVYTLMTDAVADGKTEQEVVSEYCMDRQALKDIAGGRTNLRAPVLRVLLSAAAAVCALRLNRITYHTVIGLKPWQVFVRSTTGALILAALIVVYHLWLCDSCLDGILTGNTQTKMQIRRYTVWTWVCGFIAQILIFTAIPAYYTEERVEQSLAENGRVSLALIYAVVGCFAVSGIVLLGIALYRYFKHTELSMHVVFFEGLSLLICAVQYYYSAMYHADVPAGLSAYYAVPCVVALVYALI